MTTAEPKLQLRLKNILVTTDFSEGSAWALPHAIELGRQHGSKIVMLTAVPPEPFAGVPLDPLHHDYVELQLAEQRMARFAESRMLGGLQHQEVVRQGHIWDVVRSVVKESNIDLIVLATHGRTGLKHLVMGSVAEQIFRHAECPVMTIGPHAAERGAGPFRKVLYATDFSESAQRALPYAAALARESGATLIALNVGEYSFGEGVDLSPQLLSGIEKLLRDRVHATEEASDCECVCRLGAPSDEILNVAAEQGVDLIVMGLNRHSALATHLPWATAHRVVAGAMCPVLTVR